MEMEKKNIGIFFLPILQLYALQNLELRPNKSEVYGLNKNEICRNIQLLFKDIVFLFVFFI